MGAKSGNVGGYHETNGLAVNHYVCFGSHPYPGDCCLGDTNHVREDLT